MALLGTVDMPVTGNGVRKACSCVASPLPQVLLYAKAQDGHILDTRPLHWTRSVSARTKVSANG
jgi:hypothetical protein